MMMPLSINGNKQWLHIKGKEEKEILLFVHGGPGLTSSYYSERIFKHLYDDYLIVNWDQRGSGKSFSFRTPKKTFAIEQFVEDLRAVSEYLIKTYNKEKIYLVTHSFGSLIGLLAVQKYPHLFHAYLGIGQIVSLAEADKVAYSFVLTEAEKENDKETLRNLKKIHNPNFQSFKTYSIFRRGLEKYGGFWYKRKTNLLSDYILPLLKSEQYSFFDIGKWACGLVVSIRTLWDSLYSVNFMEDVKALPIPIIILTGEFDYITPSNLSKMFLEGLEAPYKEFIMVEKSAHNVHIEKNDIFIECCLKLKEHGS